MYHTYNTKDSGNQTQKIVLYKTPPEMQIGQERWEGHQKYSPLVAASQKSKKMN